MSTELERLRKEAHEVYELGQNILDEFAGKDIPEEKLSEANGYFDKFEGMETRIKALERSEAIAKRQGEPANQLPLGRNGGQGDDPNGGRDTSVFKSFGHQLQAVAKASKSPYAYFNERPDEAKALGLNEGVGSEGGFLVMQDASSELIKRTIDMSEVYSRTRSIPISANANGIKLNAIDETSRANGSRWGGIQAYWEAEAGTKTASKPKFRKVVLDLKKLIGLCYATDELLADAMALEEVIQMGFSEEFSFKADDVVYEGDGVGKPLGMMNAPSLITVPKETGQVAATIVPQNIVKMWSRMWAPSRKNAVWYINQDIEPQLLLMSLAVGTGGVPLYMPPGGLSAAPYGTILGRPVIPIEFASTLGTTGDIALADPSQMLRIDKGGMQSATSIHVQFVTDETAFRFVWRIDVQDTWNAPLTPFKGTNTLSPYVVLATRS